MASVYTLTIMPVSSSLTGINFSVPYMVKVEGLTVATSQHVDQIFHNEYLSPLLLDLVIVAWQIA